MLFGMTKRWGGDEHSLDSAAEALREGRLVAFPTETVYGLGASIFSEGALRAIFAVKGRPSDNPLIVHLACEEQLALVVKRLPPLFAAVQRAFMPGPLTVLLEKKEGLSSLVTAGQATVGLRFPSHPVAQALLRRTGPLAAPSANLSGCPSSTTADHVLHDFMGKIAGVVDGGACTVGLESTVLSLAHSPPLLLRPGVIDKEQLEAVIGPIQTVTSPVASPGMKYRHYAPCAKVYLFETREKLENHLSQRLFKRCLRLIPTAATLYAAFRRADQEGYEEILIQCDEEIKAQEALMNRLRKASERPVFLFERESL